MSSKFDKIFRKHDPLKEEELLGYLGNQLSAEDTHRIEEILADNAFYADAVEGLEMLDNTKRNKIIQNLKEENKSIVNENSSTTDWKQIFKVAVAAGVALLIGLFFLFKGDDSPPLSNRSVTTPTTKEVATLPEQSEINLQQQNVDRIRKEQQDLEDEEAIQDQEEDPIEEAGNKEGKKKKKKNEPDYASKPPAITSLANAPASGSTIDSAAANRSSGMLSVKEDAALNRVNEHGVNEFKIGDYEKAILLFEKELLVHPENHRAAYYCGLAYSQLRNYRAAYIKFSTIVNATNNAYTEDALWHKAQTLINLKDIPAAKICLTKIITDKGKHYLAAQQLLLSLGN